VHVRERGAAEGDAVVVYEEVEVGFLRGDCIADRCEES
jgi:hypothetical protein